MANASNKHKAQGKKPVVKKESWWTPQRIKIAIAAAVVVILALIGLKIYDYVEGLQDSIVGKWSYQFEASDNGDAMEVVFTFNEDETCNFVPTRSGEQEATMEGKYAIDDNYDVITLMLGSDYSTIMQYYYKCEDTELAMQDFTTYEISNYTKIVE